MSTSIRCVLALLALGNFCGADPEPVRLSVNFASSRGLIRPLHGINKGPLAPGGLIDLSKEQRALRLPSIRLHDCHWPNPDVVDIHVLFPDFTADPERSESYDFARTDEYIAAARATGAEIVFRLGESIEHTNTRRHVHPPKDAEKWATIACGVIRHYNEGWASGFHHGIRYWEIWNEPENRPAMWSGTDADYFRLYKTAAQAIKTRFPAVKIGGPAVGAPGTFDARRFRPSAFVTAFLDFCKRESLPLDFFSWHCYSADPEEIARRAIGIRDLLDARGFAGTESHLNEWNYLPDNSWEPLARTASARARAIHYSRIAGSEGAAFIAATLIGLHDCRIDMANLFHGELGGFGLFDEHGLPGHNYDAILAFSALLDTPRRIDASGNIPGKLAIIAGQNAEKTLARILVSNFATEASRFQIVWNDIPWGGPSLAEIRRIDGQHRFDHAEILPLHDSRCDVLLPRPALMLISLRPR